MAKKLISTNPSRNFEKLGEVTVSSKDEINKKVRMAHESKLLWKEMGVSKRIEILKHVYDECVKRKDEIALLTTREMGMPIKESGIEWDLNYFKHFLEHGEEYLRDEITYKNRNTVHKIVFEPVGVAAVITPWNFPFGNFLWGVIQNLIVGNTVVFKHSEYCPLTGKFMEEIMNKCNLPDGIFSEVYGDGKIGKILANSDVDMIWFTGSTAIGKKLYEVAGKKFIGSLMELGGSNPAIIFDDVNADKIVERVYTKRFMNCGQVCDATKRLIVHEAIFDRLVEKLVAYVKTKIVGDAEDPATDIGPLVSKKQLNVLKSQVNDAVRKGAKIMIGGKSPARLKGAYYMPTILTNIKPDMRVWKEEVFGPVLPVVSFKTEAEVVKLANDTQYGLGAIIYSGNKERARRIALKLEAGCVDINEGNHWDSPATPFGGYKSSGKGREHGRHGFQELCQIKVIAE
jgi:succinate-semialdehyde dehydrogenase/glutarate-semialdehyde dehydrogenase